MSGPKNPLAGLSPATDEITAADVQDMARQVTPQILQELYRIAMGHTREASPAVRVAAAKEILDRGVGKAAQLVEVNTTTTQIIQQLSQVVEHNERPEPTDS